MEEILTGRRGRDHRTFARRSKEDDTACSPWPCVREREMNGPRCSGARSTRSRRYCTCSRTRCALFTIMIVEAKSHSGLGAWSKILFCPGTAFTTSTSVSCGNRFQPQPCRFFTPTSPLACFGVLSRTLEHWWSDVAASTMGISPLRPLVSKSDTRTFPRPENM